MVILYFFMLRPQAKKQKDKELMIANLSKGDKVITIGGIVGTISGFKEKGKLVTVKVDSNTTVIDLMVQNDTFRGVVSSFPIETVVLLCKIERENHPTRSPLCAVFRSYSRTRSCTTPSLRRHLSPLSPSPRE